MNYYLNMFDIQIAEGTSAWDAVGPRRIDRSHRHKYSYFTAATDLNNNTLH